VGALDEILRDPPNGAKQRSDHSTSQAPTAEDESGLPDAKDTSAHARAANKPVYSLHCLKGAEGCFSFQYVALDSHSQFRAEKEGQIIVLRFAGTKIWEVSINGLNLWRLYDLIHQHRMMWIRKDDRGFEASGADKEPLIKGIEIKEIEREG
jgi:hypothetical protein